VHKSVRQQTRMTSDQFREKIPYFHKSNGSDEPQWRLRVLQRRNTYDRLKREGKLALLGLGSILLGVDPTGEIPRLEEHTNAKSVFKDSIMYKIHSFKTNSRVSEMPTKEYQRAEEAFQSFMSVVILSIEDLDDPKVLADFFELKKWVYRHMNGSASVDQILAYFKWLTKVCQALFLRSQIPDEEGFFPKIFGDKTPFRSGKFAFIEELLKLGVRKLPINKEQAYCLSQLASGTRALPYPSKHIVSKQVEETCKLITTKIPQTEESKRSHRGGVQQILNRLHEPKDYKTHISLGNSACDELPKSEGGKATWLTANAKLFCEQDITPEILVELQGTKDCFGFNVLDVATLPQIASIANNPENLLDIKIGDILYLEPHEATTYLLSLDVSERNRLPKDLTKVLLLESCKEVQKFGHYNQPIKPNRFNLPIFTDITGLKFIPDVTAIPVTAALSIESALKSRLVTAAPAGYTELGQTMNNFMRNYLTQDAFLKIGFEEPDKLWQLAKAYEKYFYNSPPKDDADATHQ
jgi:hypothetical protein